MVKLEDLKGQSELRETLALAQTSGIPQKNKIDESRDKKKKERKRKKKKEKEKLTEIHTNISTRHIFTPVLSSE